MPLHGLITAPPRRWITKVTMLDATARASSGIFSHTKRTTVDHRSRENVHSPAGWDPVPTRPKGQKSSNSKTKGSVATSVLPITPAQKQGHRPYRRGLGRLT